MSGDESGEYLKWLYERYGHAIYSHVRRLLRDEDAAWDVTQDTFLALMRSEDLPHEVTSPRAWLFQTATNRAWDWLRQRSRRSGGSPSQELQASGDSEEEEGALVAYAGGMGRVEARQELEKLLHGEREPIYVAALLHFGADYTIDEVSLLLDISRRTASTYLRRFVERATKRRNRFEQDLEAERSTPFVPPPGWEEGSEDGPEGAL
jgi:RNA polymerase sigma factor (sigma-70 family)